MSGTIGCVFVCLPDKWARKRDKIIVVICDIMREKPVGSEHCHPASRLCAAAVRNQSLHTQLVPHCFFLLRLCTQYPSSPFSLCVFRGTQISLEKGSEYQIGISYLMWEKKSQTDKV